MLPPCAASLCRHRSMRLSGQVQKSFERDTGGTPPCRRVRSNAVGPVTQRDPPSSGCAATPRIAITFGRQNCADNSRHCDTEVHARHIVRIFGAGRIGTVQHHRPSRMHQTAFPASVSGASCGSDYLSYRWLAELNNVSTMDVTALVSIRRRVCSH
jgi:hypothetical protein